MSNWQPIATAPKEKEVIVWINGWVSILTLTDCYGPTIQHPNNPPGDAQRRISGIKNCYEWRDNSGDGGQNYNPSHWMPIPEPPNDWASGVILIQVVGR